VSSIFDQLWVEAAAMLDTVFEETLTLLRGGVESDEFEGSRTGPDATEYDEQDMPTNAEERVWIVPKAIVLDGDTIVPRAGDILQRASGEQWQILPTGGSPSVTEEDDDRWRVRTKLVSR